MCGIAGVAQWAEFAALDTTVTAMTATLAHRGPDDSGVWCAPDGRTCLGHRRLAVIDLTPAGHQPMADERGELHITFNGEIYNYQALRDELRARGHSFRTQTDTEVILHAFRQWGTGAVARLNGMFAFALYDQPRQRLILARDRAGEKPLFYRHRARSLAFASELKALLADPHTPRRLDGNGMLAWMAYGYVPGETTILEGIRKLAAGSIAVCDVTTGSLDVQRYWSLPEPSPAGVPVEELVDELERLLTESARLRLLADVPVGILLSGGLDSSLITAVAARERPSVRTFTVTFPGHADHDESRHARTVARHFGTDHTELAAELPAPDLLPVLARQVDEPMADSSLIPTYLVSKLIRSSATVALGGDGGDEVFAGYLHYSWLQRQDQIRKVVPRPALSAAGAVASRALPLGFRGRNLVLGVGPTIGDSLARRNQFFDKRARMRLLAPDLRAQAGQWRPPEDHILDLCRPGRSTLQQATAVDFQTYLPEDILVKVDRASMLTSLEVRAPWLDHRLVEFAFGAVPDRLRATVANRKILPKLLARRLLPGTFDLNRKHGFSVPLREWFAQGWESPVAAVLRDAGRELFDRAVVEALIVSSQRGANSERLLGLAMFELWRQEYRIGLPA